MEKYTATGAWIETEYNFTLQTPKGEVLCSITKNETGTYYPYVKEQWTEDKEVSLYEAIDSCLKYLGVPSKDRVRLCKEIEKLINTKT